MATTIRAQVSLDSDSAIPRDMCQNTFHFRSTSVDPVDDAEDAATQLAALYNSMEEFWSKNLAGTGRVKWYNLVDAEPRVPIATQLFTFTPGTGTALPNECAVVLSYRGVNESGSNPKRRRGRIYFGPLAVAVAANRTGDLGFDMASIGPDFRNQIQATLIDNLSETNATWCVFSPTTAGATPWSAPTLAASSFDVVAFHLDNAFDTVRSRGLGPTDRVSYP